MKGSVFGRYLFSIGLSVLVVMSAPAAAQTLREAVEAAWSRGADTLPAASAQPEAEARREVARNWLAAAPSLTLAERNDRLYDDLGRRTQEIEISLPVWRWGQRSASNALAESEVERAGAEFRLARWQLAGEVREAVWAAALEASEADFARQRLAVFDKIAGEVKRHVEVGDLARADWLLANGERLTSAATLLEAERRAETAARHYRRLTGYERWQLPAAAATVLNPDGEMLADHPRLQLAELDQRLALRKGEAVAESTNEPIEFSLGLERERERYGEATADQLRLGLKIPFGGSGWNRPAVAAAGAARTRAELQARAVRLAVDADTADARSALVAANTSLTLAGERRQAAEEHAALLRKGFALGETGLAARLRGEILLLDAQAGLARQQLVLGQTRSRYEHSLGLLP